MIEDTRCGKKCAFVKAGICSCDEECPNFMESIWEDCSTGKNRVVRDCVPQRLLLESHQNINRHVANQKVIEQLRNKVESLEALLLQIIGESKKHLEQQQSQNRNQLPYE